MLVVGVDESPGSAAALRWALRECKLRKTGLTVLHAWDLPMSSVSGFPLDASVLRACEASAENVVDAALEGSVDDVKELEGSVEIERVVIRGGAAEALLRAAEGAELLVVGSRGRGGFKSLLLGSVSQQCAQHATCPVVIVPTDPRTISD